MRVELLREADIREDAVTEFDFFGRPAIAFASGGRLNVFLNVCTHLGGPLALAGETLQCQWHQACFEAATGQARTAPAPATSRLIRLPIRIEDGTVFYVYGE